MPLSRGQLHATTTAGDKGMRARGCVGPNPVWPTCAREPSASHESCSTSLCSLLRTSSHNGHAACAWIASVLCSCVDSSPLNTRSAWARSSSESSPAGSPSTATNCAKEPHRGVNHSVAPRPCAWGALQSRSPQGRGSWMRQGCLLQGGTPLLAARRGSYLQDATTPICHRYFISDDLLCGMPGGQRQQRPRGMAAL